MAEFKREERYIVIKRKHLDLSTEGRLRGVLYDLDISTVECVVVEEDWHPIYQETWKNVQRLAEGRPSIGEELDSLQSQLSEASREASGLAMSLWKNHYKDESPNFGLCDTVAGIITQIDNMVAGINEQLSEARAQRDALLIAGQPMSNACYNLSQWADRLPDGQAEVLKELHEDWDVALSSLRQQGKG